MTEKVNAIVLGTVKHSDRHNITTLYTRECGRMAVATPAGSGRTACARRALMMPLSAVEATVGSGAGRDIGRLVQVSALECRRSLYFDPVKMSVGMFVAEFIGRLVRDSGADARLWDYVADSLRLLDCMPSGRAVANFPIVFLSTLTAFVGITPDVGGFSEGKAFDMRAGAYSDLEPGHGDVLRGRESRMACLLSRMSYANSGRVRFSREERRAVMEGILRYYSIHLPGIGTMRSPEVLKEVLG